MSDHKSTKNSVSHDLILEKIVDLQQFYGANDQHLQMIGEAFNIAIDAHGNNLRLSGEIDNVRCATDLVLELEELCFNGLNLTKEEVRSAIRAAMNAGFAEKMPFTDLVMGGRTIDVKTKKLYPKTPNQKEYIDSIRRYDLVFGIGPAGTGKTYLAVAMAVTFMLEKKINRIILARPAVEAGENLGFLPGDMLQKVNPYLRPLYDALFDLLDMDRANRLIERGLIEIAPLAFMRGRTLNDAFIILDEAQNTSPEQMKMFLTRLGMNAKAVITGDITQIDLPKDRTSGLVHVQHILKPLDSIKFIYFNKNDVVRCKLVQEIVEAYEMAEEQADKRFRLKPLESSSDLNAK